MSGRSRRACRCAVEQGPARPEPVLRRDRRLWSARAAALAGDPSGVTVGSLEKAGRSRDELRRVHGAFLLGRSRTDEPDDLRFFAELLAGVTTAALRDLQAHAELYVEAAMSRALLEGRDTGLGLLRPLVADGGLGTTRDYAAAAYLAELGDPSGLPVVRAALRSPTAHVRLMATRSLLSFAHLVPTQTAGVDVRALLLERLDDEPYVAQEVPHLLAEAWGEDLPTTG